MKTIKDFTPEVQAKIPEYLNRYTKGVFDGGRYNNFKIEDAEALINWNYETAGYKKPVAIVAENPLESQVFFNYIKNNKAFLPLIYAIYCLKNGIEVKLDLPKDHSQLGEYNYDYLFTANVYSNALIAWYSFMANELKIDAPINVMLNSWSDLYEKSGVYSAVFSELISVVSKYPKQIHRNDNNDMHSINGPAVEWGAGTDFTKFGCFYVNGRNVPDWVVTDRDSENYFDKFQAEENEDVKAGVITVVKENGGNEGLLKFLNAVLVDEKVIEHFEGYSETLRLYKTKDKYSFLQDRFGNMNQPYAWSEMTCPSTGSTYLIDNSADFTCAIEAAKFLRPSFVPAALKYQWAHSAN